MFRVATLQGWAGPKEQQCPLLVKDSLPLELVIRPALTYGNKGGRKITKFPFYLQPTGKSLKQAE